MNYLVFLLRKIVETTSRNVARKWHAAQLFVAGGCFGNEVCMASLLIRIRLI